MNQEYLIQCWYCLGEYDAASAVWCSCDPKNPTKLCPYCLQCFCRATEDYKARFLRYAPESLLHERASLRRIKDRLGELLVRGQVVSMEELVSALNKQTESGQKLGQLLITENVLTSEELEIFLKIQNMSVASELGDHDVDANVLQRLNPEFCMQRTILPIKVFEASTRAFLILAMANPNDLVTIEIVNRKTEMFVIPFYADEFVLKEFLERYVPPGGVRILEQETTDYQAALRRIIVAGIKRHASDIHIEPDESEISIRYRIDGVLYKVKSPPKRDQAPLTLSLKKLAKMDLHKSGLPQTSKMILKHDNKKYQLNILTFPNPYGESISIKIVDLSTFLRDLSEIGFNDAEYSLVKAALDSSHGLVLVSGPLMNGCNTTLYAIMRYLSGTNRKVVTLESPIFARIPNLHQSEINPSGGFDFITGLNSIIRSDPDVIVLSDIADAEVAATVCKIAAQCVVISTVSAFSSANTIVMLRDLGISPALLSQALSIVITQRLIRKICAQCCEQSPVSHSLLQRMGLTEQEASTLSAYVGAGCSECNYLGFGGRIPVFEVLANNSQIGEVIASGGSAREIESAAVATGMVTLRKRCLDRINEGVTTLEEFQKGKF